jgi:hypothetical protein
MKAVDLKSEEAIWMFVSKILMDKTAFDARCNLSCIVLKQVGMC